MRTVLGMSRKNARLLRVATLVCLLVAVAATVDLHRTSGSDAGLVTVVFVLLFSGIVWWRTRRSQVHDQA
jgi:hypothetical protein